MRSTGFSELTGRRSARGRSAGRARGTRRRRRPQPEDQPAGAAGHQPPPRVRRTRRRPGRRPRREPRAHSPAQHHGKTQVTRRAGRCTTVADANVFSSASELCKREDSTLVAVADPRRTPAGLRTSGSATPQLAPARSGITRECGWRCSSVSAIVVVASSAGRWSATSPRISSGWSPCRESSSIPGPSGTGGQGRMPTVNGVGEPCAREPHARFDAAGAGNGADLTKDTGVAQPAGKPAEHEGPGP